jgi:hypothetical protein
MFYSEIAKHFGKTEGAVRRAIMSDEARRREREIYNRHKIAERAKLDEIRANMVAPITRQVTMETHPLRVLPKAYVIISRPLTRVFEISELPRPGMSALDKRDTVTA